MVDINKDLEIIDKQIDDAQNILFIAKTSGNSKLLEKAEGALKQFLNQKKELLGRISIEERNKMPEGFKLNIEVGKETAETKPIFGKEESEFLPPHEKR